MKHFRGALEDRSIPPQAVDTHGELDKTNFNILQFLVKMDRPPPPAPSGSASLGWLESPIEEHGQSMKARKDKMDCSREFHAEARFSTESFVELSDYTSEGIRAIIHDTGVIVCVRLQ